jgi:hypothetical protein
MQQLCMRGRTVRTIKSVGGGERRRTPNAGSHAEATAYRCHRNPGGGQSALDEADELLDRIDCLVQTRRTPA